MSNERTGGPAYPERNFEWDSSRDRMREVSYRGPSLLDHFAGLALQGVLASNPNIGNRKWVEGDAPVLASCAYAFAAAMIAERTRIMNEKP